MSSIERAFQVLNILANAPEGVRVTDLAVTMNLNRAIPHRLLAELVALGYVVQIPATERYKATFKLGSLGLRQLETAGVTRWAQDELGALARETGELVRLAVAGGDGLLFVAKAKGADNILILDPVSGADVVLHATATGKAWLSTLPIEMADRLLNERGLDVKTPRTETDIERVLAEVSAARQSGYAVTYQEMEAGVNAIASPIVPPNSDDGRGIGTVSIAGPAVRLTPEVLENFAPALKATAASLAAQWHVYEYLADLSRPSAASSDASS